MTQDKTNSENNEAGGNRRFRLPKLFADSDETAAADETAAESRRIAERASALGVTLPAPTLDEGAIAAANRPYEGEPRASVLQVAPEEIEAMNAARELSAEAASNASDDTALKNDVAPSTDADLVKSELARANALGITTSGVVPGEVTTRTEDSVLSQGGAMEKLNAMQTDMAQMSRLLNEICDRGTAQDKVFNTLHSELQDYKNDFIYEHLKPVVRTLLFLYDSIEQFDSEMSLHERPGADERRGVSPAVVRQNIGFFREQLIEALRICEVTPMENPEGLFDPKMQKAVDITPVEASQENMIQRVVRIGWYLNGRIFRPTEVVIGKTTEEYNSQIWNQGHKPHADEGETVM